MGALGSSLGASGCVERLIHDLGKGADGDGDGGTTVGDDGPGETDQSRPGETETDGVDPGTECQQPSDCGTNQTCFEGVCVGTGSLRISLSWTVVTDLDLHLYVPNGDWMSFENTTTAYGELDVDDCVGGSCINQQVHVENIFLDASAPRGTYGIQVVNFDGRGAADYSIEVAGAVNSHFFGHLPASDFAQSEVHEIAWAP